MELLLSIRSTADGKIRETKCAIDNGLVVGRGAEKGVLLDGPDLSREHLILTTDGSHIYVTDLSSNGTWLNGIRLQRSVRNRVRSEDLIEVPGYVLTFKPAEQQEKAEEPVRAQLPREIAPPVEPPPAEVPAGPLGMLAPVSRFVGSFTSGEKFLVLIGLCGLLLLYTYMAS